MSVINKNIKKISFLALLITAITYTSQAQDSLRVQPRFWYGGAIGANFNFFTGTTQRLNSDVKATSAFHNGFGTDIYLGGLFEYRPHPVWGFMLNAGFDGRDGTFESKTAPCNCEENLKARVGYISIEPSLRIAPFANRFYLFVGGAYRYNVVNDFKYTQEQQPDRKGSFSNINKSIFAGQVGAGYDIPLKSATSRNQVDLSPFVSYHPYFGQDPRSVESWSLTTVRAGVALKFGRVPDGVVVKNPVSGVQFSIVAPAAVPANTKVNETFPLRNFVFFDAASVAIPSRYILLNNSKATEFKEAQLQEPDPEDFSGRSKRQLKVYYNILNILGDRMRTNPLAVITLVGSSSGKGADTGKLYAEAVKNYLVNVYGIDASRIKVEGRNQPLVPSIQPGGTKDLELLGEGDRRVDIITTTAALLAPVKIKAIQEDPMNSRVLFRVKPDGKDKLSFYNLEITDSKGKVQNYGPFNKEQESVSANVILGDNKEGIYKVVMIGQTVDGVAVKRESSMYLKRNAAPQSDALRFSILFDFDKSNSVAAYDKFLIEEVAPLVQDSGTVIIHGYSDIIGEPDYNKELSEKRAADAFAVIQKALIKAGRKGVNFQVYGFGADVNAAPFENNLPEELFYNRTVIIDVVPFK